MGTGSFENDFALDWLNDLKREGPAFVGQSLAMKSSISSLMLGYIDADEASGAIAAAEIVAAALGRPPRMWPDRAREWIAAHRAELRAEELRDKALGAIAIIQEGSELRELWAAEERFWPEWLAAIGDLEQRLKTATPP